MDENTRELICFEKEKRELKSYYVSFLNYLEGKIEKLSDEEKKIYGENLYEISSKVNTLREKNLNLLMVQEGLLLLAERISLGMTHPAEAKLLDVNLPEFMWIDICSVA